MRLRELREPQAVLGADLVLEFSPAGDFALVVYPDGTTPVVVQRGDRPDRAALLARYERMRTGQDPDYVIVPRRTLEWTNRVSQDQVVWIDVSKFDRDWRQDPYAYVGPGGQFGIVNALGNRYDQFGRWFDRGLPIEMPEVGIADRGGVYFKNGRHRFAWMRDHGVHALPVAVSPEDVAELTRRCGTGERTTRLPSRHGE